MCVLIFSTTSVWNISNSKTNSARYYCTCARLYAKYLLFLSGFNETCIFLTHFWKHLNTKFHGKPSIGIRVVL